MKFTKMQGTGNDFIVINNIELQIPIEKLPLIARKVCERKVSVGADALMVVDSPEKGGDFQMRFYNADGSIGEMCGNGARCIARYAYENKIAGESMKIETMAGMVLAYRIDRRKFKIRLNNPMVIKLDNKITIEGICDGVNNIGKIETECKCAYVELGNPGLPHAVVDIEEFDCMQFGEGIHQSKEGKLYEIGKKIRNYEGFPKGANVNFYSIIDGNDVRVQTFERGVEDFTLACGTGSGSTALVLTLKGLVQKGKTVNLHTPGGILSVDVELNQEAGEETSQETKSGINQELRSENNQELGSGINQETKYGNNQELKSGINQETGSGINQETKYENNQELKSENNQELKSENNQETGSGANGVFNDSFKDNINSINATTVKNLYLIGDTNIVVIGEITDEDLAY